MRKPKIQPLINGAIDIPKVIQDGIKAILKAAKREGNASKIKNKYVLTALMQGSYSGIMKLNDCARLAQITDVSLRNWLKAGEEDIEQGKDNSSFALLYSVFYLARSIRKKDVFDRLQNAVDRDFDSMPYKDKFRYAELIANEGQKQQTVIGDQYIQNNVSITNNVEKIMNLSMDDLEKYIEINSRELLKKNDEKLVEDESSKLSIDNNQVMEAVIVND